MQTITVYGGWLTDAGSYLGKASRSGLDIIGKAINTVASRGGADSADLVTTGNTTESDYTTPALLAGAAVLGVLFLTKKKKRRK